MVSCTSTTVRRDDHSYSYVYQHNQNPSEDIPKPKLNRKTEVTTYKQEYNNFKTEDSDMEYVDQGKPTELSPYNGNIPNTRSGISTQLYQPIRNTNKPIPSKKEFNPYDNQFINSSYKPKSQESEAPDFGPEGFVMVESRVPNSNPPVYYTHYYPAKSYK